MILIFIISAGTAFAEEPPLKQKNTYLNQETTQPSLPSTFSKEKKPPLLERVTNPEIKSYLQQLESAQQMVGNYVQSSGEVIDRFFGSDALDIISKKNHLTIYSPVTFYQGGKTVSNLDFKLQIDLPKTNNRWKVFLSSFDEQEESNTTTLNQNNDGLNGNRDNRLGGRYLINDNKNRITQTDIGMKFINFIEPNPYIEFEDRVKNKWIASIESRTTNTILLERNEGLAWQGEQVFDKKMGVEGLLRSQTRLNWWRKDSLRRIKQRFAYFHQFSPYRANAYYIDANWLADDLPQRFDNLTVGMNWRERLYKRWLFAELEPRVIYYKNANGFSQPHYSLKLLLEMHF